MKSEWQVHQGKKFMYCNYANFQRDAEGLRQEVEAVDAIICELPEHSVLSLTDVRETVGTPEAMEVFKESASRTKQHILKQAVVGVGGLRRVLLNAVSRFSGQDMVPFDDIEAAKDWLVEE